MNKAIQILIISGYLIVILRYLLISKVSYEVIELKYSLRPPGSLVKIIKDLKKLTRKNTTGILYHSYKREKLPTDLKFILKWTDSFTRDGFFGKNGQKKFIDNQCEYHNCYVTDDKSFLIDPSYFDAVLFDYENEWDLQPRIRSVHQKYIFSASEAADYIPICDPYFDTYYNLTWTYKLDSDIRWSYITILDLEGNFIGPKTNMKWIEQMKPTSLTVINILSRKRKAVAWFVANCQTKIKREDIAKEIVLELRKYNLEVDTYGACGRKMCPRDDISECLELLEEEYYFYLSVEDFVSEDYVTEKLLYPITHYTVPIVYGGANYSRFLPPGSYINAKEEKASRVAYLINEAIKKPEIYYSYFKWHNHYKYKKSPNIPDVCELCRVLNDPSKTTTIVKNFRKWWNKDFEKTCSKVTTTETNNINIFIDD